MTAENGSIAGRIAMVRQRIAAAASAAGRPPREITLVAVSKTVALESIAEAVSTGIEFLGENYVQELLVKCEKFPQIQWHMIGHLQSNKVKYIVGKCAMIQTVDSIALAEQIGRRARLMGLTQPALIEVNVGIEPRKSGVIPGELWPLMDQALAVQGLDIRGLMAIPPAGDESRPWFARMRLLLDEARQRYPGTCLSVLSMGMSADFEAAIAEGATMVRVGSAIFGPRPQALR